MCFKFIFLMVSSISLFVITSCLQCWQGKEVVNAAIATVPPTFTSQYCPDELFSCMAYQINHKHNNNNSKFVNSLQKFCCLCSLT